VAVHKSQEYEELKKRIEALEDERENFIPSPDLDNCPKCGISMIETTCLGDAKRNKMCPKCGQGYGFDHMEYRSGT